MTTASPTSDLETLHDSQSTGAFSPSTRATSISEGGKETRQSSLDSHSRDVDTGFVRSTPVPPQQGVGRSSIASCILQNAVPEDDNRIPYLIGGVRWRVDVVVTGDEDESSGKLFQAAIAGDFFAFVYSVDSKESFDFLSTAMHIVRKAQAKRLQMPIPQPVNSQDNNPFVFGLIANKADTPNSARQVSVSEGANMAKAGGGIFVETSAQQALTPVNEDGPTDGPDSAVQSLLIGLTRARKWRRTPGETFNPNIGVIEDKWWAAHGKGQNPSSPSVQLPTSFNLPSDKQLQEQEEDINAGSQRSRRKGSKDLRMDRRMSHSIGGLGRDPNDWKNDRMNDGAGCKCVIS